MRADQASAPAAGTVATPTDPASSIVLQVAARHDEAQGIVSFELRHSEGLPLPPFDAGAHLLVEAAPGLTRAYSLCNDPGDRDRYLIAVLLGANPLGGSAALHRQLQPGMTLRASKPRNAFPMSPEGRRSILLGGGIGVTPLLAMAEMLAARQADFTLHYCTRDAARTAFAQRIAGSRFAATTDLHPSVSTPSSCWHGRLPTRMSMFAVRRGSWRTSCRLRSASDGPEARCTVSSSLHPNPHKRRRPTSASSLCWHRAAAASRCDLGRAPRRRCRTQACRW